MSSVADYWYSHRNAQFWVLNVAGWSVYTAGQIFRAELVEGSRHVASVVSLIAISGILLCGLLRHIYRRLHTSSPAIIIGVVVLCSSAVAFALRLIGYATYRALADPDLKPWTLVEFTVAEFSGMYLMLCWSAAYFGFRYYESMHEQREAAARAVSLAHEAQLKMLRFQLNPHFLFNTLNSISTLILDKNEDSASNALAQLSVFLRHTLSQDPTDRLPLRKELETLNLYLGIEQLRFGSRLRLELLVEERALDALVPGLILQPIVENAVKHAIAQTDSGGLIRIEAFVRDSMLEMIVADDGPGMPEPSLPQESSGIGLRNTRERLAASYGQNHRFALTNGTRGLRVEMALPLELRTRSTEQQQLQGAQDRHEPYRFGTSASCGTRASLRSG